MATITKEDRDSQICAASLMEAACPSERDRVLVLRQLLDSVVIAEGISSDVWAVTLFDHGFRVNVGPVEVMTFRTVFQSPETTLLEVRLLLHGQVTQEVEAALAEGGEIHNFFPSRYKSVPQPQFVYMGLGNISSGGISNENYRELEKALKLLRSLHADFIGHAAKTPTGGIRQSSNYRRSHSAGLYAYASSLIQKLSETPYKLDQDNEINLLEGNTYSVQATVYERNPIAREKCIAHYGTPCFVCGFSFGARYGGPAKDYIHVHHLKPLASAGTEYIIDPINDLRPVCANCHAVIHLRQPPYAIEEVKAMLHGMVMGGHTAS